MILKGAKYLPLLLLTTASPVLFLFASNLNELNYSFLWFPLILTLAISLALFLILNIFIRDTAKATVLASVFMFLFLTYGHFRNFLINQLKVIQVRSGYIFIVWLSITALCVCLIHKKDAVKAYAFLKFFSLFLLAIPLANMGWFELNQTGFNGIKLKNIKTTAINTETPQSYPDIYYLVPDEYPGIETLKDMFGYRNEDFTGFLNNAGFLIPAKSVSSYPITYFSLASTLNMDYLDDLRNKKRSVPDDFSIPQQMIENNKVAGFLKERGYKFIAFDSGYPMSGYNKQADIQFDGGYLDRFTILVLRSSMLQPLYSRRELFGFSGTNELRKRLLYNFDKLAEVPNIPGPKFVFFHIVSPHPPFLFDRNGKKRNITSAVIKNLTVKEYLDFFLDQLIFTNRKMESAIETVLSKSTTKPVFIIQSDHGFGFSGDIKDPEAINDPVVRAKNFSAFLLPDKNKNVLPRNMSNVNSFRLVLDQYFNTNLGMLENKSYIYNYKDSYDFSNLVKF